ncbi:porin [Paraburkholderia sp. LEh10]|uniref:porin n=1 Tax=Paraburkholderia sp. LEh10 TaxID=2821353 RepID=UPI001AE5FD4B|nr:porin [Paraburkholderia sp. LEh10]MBP0593297.1 porin [Paraburkholderia sp. LEh10]
MLRKRLIVVKLAACAGALMAGGAAKAQSSVTLYGVVDAGLLYTSKTANASDGSDAGKQFSLISAGLTPSVFGVSGTEDLGDGLKLNFKLESGFSVVNGGLANCNGNLFGCQAWIALDGKYGTGKVGLQFSPFFLALYQSDPRDFSMFGSGLVNMVDNVFATSVYNSNAISYSSPNISGFQASLMYALGGAAGNFQAGRQYSASLKYELGGFMINAAIYDGNSGGTAQTPIPTTVQFEGRTIGAAYKFGAVTAKLSFVNYKVAGSFNNNVYGGGLDYHVLPTLDVNGGVWVTSDRNQTSNHSVMGSLGAQYFLSKRTMLYAQVGAVNNHGAMNTGISINGALFGTEGTTVASVIGVRHSF